MAPAAAFLTNRRCFGLLKRLYWADDEPVQANGRTGVLPFENCVRSPGSLDKQLPAEGFNAHQREPKKGCGDATIRHGVLMEGLRNLRDTGVPQDIRATHDTQPDVL